MRSLDITNNMQHVHVDLDLMKKFGQFRVLIIDRASTGKMTIFQQICNLMEEIYNNQGKKVWSPKLEYARYQCP